MLQWHYLSMLVSSLGLRGLPGWHSFSRLHSPTVFACALLDMAAHAQGAYHSIFKHPYIPVFKLGSRPAAVKIISSSTSLVVATPRPGQTYPAYLWASTVRAYLSGKQVAQLEPRPSADVMTKVCCLL